MSPRNIVLLIAALAFAGATAMAIRGRMQPAKESGAAAQAERILVAKRDIQAGQFIKTMTDLEWAAWPAGTVQPYHIKESSEQMAGFGGAVARRAVRMGEPITPNTLIKPGSGGFLSAVLEPGKRAVSVAVSPTSGTAGFIFPGDRVDVMVTHRVKVGGASDETETVITETFVENVRVVAVDQMLDNPENKAILAKTVTIEVTPEQGQKISVAEDLGKISFALRSLAMDAPTPAETEENASENGEAGPLMPVAGDGEKKEQDFISALIQPQPVTAEARHFMRDRDISSVLNGNTSAAPRIRVIRGAKIEQQEFFQEGQ